MRYFRYDNGPSRRENLADAFKKAKGDIILFSDTDLAADISALKSLIQAVEGKFDVSIGSRYLKDSHTRRKIDRRVISFFYNHFIRFYLDSKIVDHNCGFKAFKKKAILELIKDAGYDKTFIRGWFWDAEILIRAQRKRMKIAEIPVRWIEPKYSEDEMQNRLYEGKDQEFEEKNGILLYIGQGMYLHEETYTWVNEVYFIIEQEDGKIRKIPVRDNYFKFLNEITF